MVEPITFATVAACVVVLALVVWWKSSDTVIAPAPVPVRSPSRLQRCVNTSMGGIASKVSGIKMKRVTVRLWDLISPETKEFSFAVEQGLPGLLSAIAAEFDLHPSSLGLNGGNARFQLLTASSGLSQWTKATDPQVRSVRNQDCTMFLLVDQKNLGSVPVPPFPDW